MIGPGAVVRGIVSRLLVNTPRAVDDSDGDKAVRLNSWREYSLPPVAPTYHALADEGSFMIATNPTVATGFAWVAAQTAFSDTTPNFYLYNASQYSIWVVYLKLISTAAATASTAIHYAFIEDLVDRALTTDNTQIVVPVCARSGQQSLVAWAGAANQQGSRLHVQNSATASVIAASSRNKKIVARGVLGGLNVAGDELQINFGSMDAGAQSATTAAEGAGQPGRRVSCSAPIIIDPGHSLTGHIWLPASTGTITPEMEMGLVAR